MSNLNPGNFPSGEEMPAYYTAKTINATAASRTAIDANLAVGAVLIEDVYQHDGRDVDSSISLDARRYINLTRCDATNFKGKRYVVTDVKNVNTLVSGSTTQRQGGIVTVQELDGNPAVQALVDGTTDVTAGVTRLIPVADQWYLVAFVTLTNINQIDTIANERVALSKETYTTNAVALKWVSGGNV